MKVSVVRTYFQILQRMDGYGYIYIVIINSKGQKNKIKQNKAKPYLCTVLTADVHDGPQIPTLRYNFCCGGII